MRAIQTWHGHSAGEGKRGIVHGRWLAGAALLLVMAPAPAQAAVNQFVMGMLASGAPPFDAASGSGQDASPSDAVVRTNDVFVYRVGYSLAPQDDNRLLTVSMGATALPAAYAGPALTPAQMGYFLAADLPSGASGCANISSTPVAWPPEAGGTASGVSADGQHIVCRQPASASASNLDFMARVGGAMPNGATIGAPTVAFQSANNPPQTTPTVLDGTVGGQTFHGAPTLTVSAAPRWLVAKRPLAGGGAFIPGSGPNGEDGYIIPFNVGVYAQGSRKGLEALRPSYTIAENFNDPDMPGARLVNWDVNVPTFATLPMGAGAEPAAQNGCGDWRGQLHRMGNTFDNTYYAAGDQGVTDVSSNNYTVARGGTCVASAVDNGAKTATLEFDGTDFSLTHYPTMAGTTGWGGTLVNVNDLDAPDNQWWVASKSILIWVPPDDLTPDVTEVLTNTATLSGTSVTGQANPPAQASADNSVIRQSGGYFTKIFTSVAIWNLDASQPQTVCDPTVTADCHVNQASPGQLLSARIAAYNMSANNFSAGYFCDKIDNTRLSVADMRGATMTPPPDPATGMLARYIAGSAAETPIAWQLGVGGAGTTGAAGTWQSRNTVASEYPSPQPSVAGPATQAAALCDEPDITWFDSIDALLAAGRSLADVTRVKGSYSSYRAATQVLAYIPLRVNASYAHSGNDTLPDGSTVSFTQGQPTPGAIVPNQGVWQRDAASDVYRSADALRITQTEYAQITKSALAPYNLNNGQVTRGATVTYSLQVNLTSSTNPHQTDVEIWDVLPQHMTYLPGSSRFGGAPMADPACTPPGQTPAAPAPFAPNSVAAGFQACRWTLANQPVAEGARGAAAGNLPVLAFQAQVSLSGPPGTALLNTSFADSTANLMKDATYSGAVNGFQCEGAQVCSVGNWTLNISNASGIVLNKTVSAQQVPTDTSFAYTLDYAAVGTTLDGVRILDVLPAAGDGRGSSYAGTLRLDGPILAPVAEAGPPAMSADPDLVVRYTSNPPGNIQRDPYHAGHNLSGTGGNTATSTNWCTAAQFGSAGCPADAGAATAFMALPRQAADGVLPTNTAYRLHVPVRVTGNALGNLYVNDFVADSPSLTARQPGSNQVSTRVVAPDPLITKTADPATIDHGQTTVFSLTVRNNSGTSVGAVADLPGTKITVTDTLPAGLQAQLPVTATGWDCAASTASQVQCSYTGALPVPADQPVGGVIAVTATGNVPGTLTNIASVGLEGQTDGNPDNNSASAAVTVNANPDQTVSGRVYREASSPTNQADDGDVVDPGIAGVRLRMVCTTPDYDQTVTTGADGGYAFTGIASGAECTITQTQPRGHVNAYNLRGPGATADSDVSPTGDSSITLTVPINGSSGNSFAETAAPGDGVTSVPTLSTWLLAVLGALLGGLAAARRRPAA